MRVVVIISLIIFGVTVNVICDEYCKPDNCEVQLPTDKGWICGKVLVAEEKYKYASFQGVPYGKPPLGHRRFKELELLEPWEGLLDTTEESPACPTKELVYGRMYMPKKGMSEDCIYLNLYIPYNPQTINNVFNNKGNSTIRLPILVNIHGGGFETGSGLPDVHGPQYLMTKNIIVISFNYRLNVFGFLSLGSKEIPGNQGLRDQLTLLRWVQKNACAFGGDPDNVTIIGQSTGAISAHLLSLSKASRGLFHRLILLSGTANINGFTASPINARMLANFFLSNLGINFTNPEVIHNQLIRLPLIKIMESFTILQNKYGVAALSPVVEKEFEGVTSILEADPFELIARGMGRNYPVIIGFAKYEAEFFRWLYLNFNLVQGTQKNHLMLLFRRLIYEIPREMQVESADKIYQFCFKGNNVTMDSLIECNSGLIFIYGAVKLAQWRAILGTPAYLYQFSYNSRRSFVREALWLTYKGGAHLDDLTYIFRVNSLIGKHVSFPPKNRDDRMKEKMTTFVTNFMRCSNPICNSNDSNWPAVSMDKLVYQDIAKPLEYRVSELSEPQNKMMQLLDSIDVKSRSVTERLQQLRNSQ